MPKPKIGVSNRRRRSAAATVSGAIKRANKKRARVMPKTKVAKLKAPKSMTWSTYDAIMRDALARDNSPEAVALREVAERKKLARKAQTPTQPSTSDAAPTTPAPAQASTGEVTLDDYRIDAARVRRYFDKRGINGAVNEYVVKMLQEHGEEVEVESKPVGKHKSDPSTPPKMVKKRVLRGDYEVRQRACANARVRVSPYATNYLRTFCEEIACDLAHLAIHGMTAKHDSIMKAEHIFHNDCEFLGNAYFRELFVGLPSFANARKKWLKYDTACYVQSIIEPLLADFAKIRDKDVMDRVKRNRTELEKFIASERATVFGSGEHDDGAKTSTETDAASSRAEQQVAPQTAMSKAKQEQEDSAKKDKDELRFIPYVKRVIHTIISIKPEFARNKPRVSAGLVQLINDILFDFVNCVSARAIVYIESVDCHTVTDGVVQEIILGMVSNPEALKERAVGSFDTETRMVRTKETEKGKAPEKVEQKRDIARVKRSTIVQFIRENYPVVVRAHRKPKGESVDDGDAEVEGEDTVEGETETTEQQPSQTQA